MLECAILVANMQELDFTVGSALPTTQLSFPDDVFGQLPGAEGGDIGATTTTGASSAGGAGAAQSMGNSIVTTPRDEVPEPTWSTPVPRRAARGANTATLDDSQPIRLRLTESSPALVTKRVPESWRAHRATSHATIGSRQAHAYAQAEHGDRGDRGARGERAAPGAAPKVLPNGLPSLDKIPSGACTGPAPRMHLMLPSLDGGQASPGSPAVGSPCGGAKRVRRTQSMFPSSQQFVSAELGPAPMPASPGPLLGDVPCFKVVEDSIPRIKSQVLADLLDGKITHQYDGVVVIDCRFEYEYAGGHIAGAVNISCKSKLEQYMFGGGIAAYERPLVIFHCEYSAYRGPLMATHLRQCDRHANVYPHLKYPDIAVLDGGYSNFYACNRGRCEPQNYVGMNDDMHKVTCEREMERFRVGMRFRKAQLFSRPSLSKLPRAKLDLHGRANQSCPMLPLAQAFQADRAALAPLNM